MLLNALGDMFRSADIEDDDFWGIIIQNLLNPFQRQLVSHSDFFPTLDRDLIFVSMAWKM